MLCYVIIINHFWETKCVQSFYEFLRKKKMRRDSGNNRLDFGGSPWTTSSPTLPYFSPPKQCTGIRQMAAPWQNRDTNGWETRLMRLSVKKCLVSSAGPDLNTVDPSSLTVAIMPSMFQPEFHMWVYARKRGSSLPSRLPSYSPVLLLLLYSLPCLSPIQPALGGTPPLFVELLFGRTCTNLPLFVCYVLWYLAKKLNLMWTSWVHVAVKRAVPSVS